MNSGRQLENTTIRALAAAIHRIYRPASPASFPGQLVRIIDGFFGSEIVTYNEFQPNCVPFVESNNGFEKETNATARFGQLMHQNPLVVKLITEKEIPGLRLTGELPMAQFRRTEIYNELYKPIGGDYQMACGFSAGRRGGHIGLALNQKSRDFTDQELFLFNLIIPHAQQAYQICHALHEARGAVDVMTTVLDGHGSGVIIFDDTYRVITITGVALKLSDAIFSCQPAEGALLPDSLLSSVLRLKGISESHPVPPRLPLSYALPDGSCALLRLALDPERARHSLILEHERGIPSVAQLAPLGLTRRESEVTHWILQGKTNWEIGTILGVSSRTVEKHVENLFAKLKVNDRRHLHHRIRESMPR